jgi:transketolase
MDRIIEISYKKRLSHIGSSITTYPILEKIYTEKNKDDIVILSAGHAGIAQYVALEKFCNYNAEELFNTHGLHPHRDINRGIHVSSGSLGSAILVAVGMAFGNNTRNVYCVISDGECGEGSVWEALSFAHLNNLTNLKIYVNINGYSAYDTIDINYLEKKLLSFLPSIIICKTFHPNIEFMEGLKAHYYVLNEEDKTKLLEITK